MNERGVYQFLGLAQKAGRILSGSDQIREGLKHKKGTLLLIAEDASERTSGEYRALAEQYRIDWRIFGEKEKLGRALGKGVRTAVLLTDSGFGNAVREKLDAGR